MQVITGYAHQPSEHAHACRKEHNTTMKPQGQGTSTRISRRLFLAASGTLAASLGVACTVSEDNQPQEAKNNSGKEKNQSGQNTSQQEYAEWIEPTRPLPIPPLAEATVVDSTSRFHLTAQTGQSEIRPGIHTPTWGFNGPHLGPTLRFSRGETVAIEVENTLAEETAVHWHGMLVPAAMDGGPHSPIAPGSSWTATYTVEQPAATCWYHPHPHGATGVQAYRGMAGMIIVDDDVSNALDLPHDYGVDDIPVVLMDANFNDDGSLNETEDVDLGLLGSYVHINGSVNPHFAASTGRIRLRLLNGSTMRFHTIALSNGQPFMVIASDSGLLSKPIEADSLQIGPGERAEIVIDLDEDCYLESIGFADNLGVPEDEYTPDFGLKDKFKLIHLQASGKKATGDLPAELDPSAQADTAEDSLIVRQFELNTFEINGKTMDMNRVDLVINHSDPEIWEVTNGNSDWIHNFHIHNCAFQVLSIDDTDVSVFDQGWKDTITIPPLATARLKVYFGQYRDNHYPYMYHCHMLYHEDQGLMGQYMILNRGENPELDTEYTRSGHQHH